VNKSKELRLGGSKMADNNEMFELLTKMYSEVQGIKSDINGRLDNLDFKFNNLENKVDNLGNKVDNLEHKVDKTNIIIENDIIPRIEALYDGYKQNTESINILTNKIDDLQTDVNNLTIRTLKNENNIIHFLKAIENRDFIKDAK
jgi:chromosome segregation ATPase